MKSILQTIIIISSFTPISSFSSSEIIGEKICQNGVFSFQFCYYSFSQMKNTCQGFQNIEGQIQGYAEDVSPNGKKIKIRLKNYFINDSLYHSMTKSLVKAAKGHISTDPVFNNDFAFIQDSIIWNLSAKWELCANSK